MENRCDCDCDFGALSARVRSAQLRGELGSGRLLAAPPPRKPLLRVSVFGVCLRLLCAVLAIL